MHEATVAVDVKETEQTKSMYNNNFITGKAPNQIKKFYGFRKLLSKITSVTFHQDEGCPCCDIEIDGINRLDHWQWVKVTNGDYSGNNWVQTGSDPIEQD